MAAPCASELKNPISIEVLTTTQDTSGGMVDGWAPDFDSWAKIRNLTGNERSLTSHGGQVQEARTEFTVRFDERLNTGIRRVVYNGKIYNIKHVNDYNENHRFMILTCETGLNDGR
jgi:SPP1 family predicted phage head-tail adaptor